ncbi:toxin-antitoxin system, toxin component, HicA family [Trichinella spiralis]|uniref:toxin-antitoxin system, toxin component, HicA family n=1 Tax=Trichinella spiralis TaxID=6334 RepID=UPI0001EFDF4A|nr:toxin-antitoxin system, toxin component, HicA family [Trichinella spiralis]
MLHVNKITLYTGCKVDRWSAAKTIHHGEVGKHRKGKRQGKKEWSVQNRAVARQPANLRCQIGLVSRFVISNSTKKRCTPFPNGYLKIELLTVFKIMCFKKIRQV